MSTKKPFLSILEKYRKISFSQKDKGERFERLMKAYLLTDPKYADKFKKVWLWSEFPGRDDLGGQDTGIDLVAVTNAGDYWAIQCKCYQETTTIDKPAVDSFLSTSSRTFKDVETLKTTSFAQRLWISTSNKWGPNALQAIQNQKPPVVRLNLGDLINAPVNWEDIENGITGEQARTPKKQLRPHQKDALDKTHEYFKDHDRGKLIMACGTGKTFNSLRIAEKETDGKGLILFLVPSIALLGQTLNAWTADAEEPINPICICSDPEITKKRKQVDDVDLSSVIDLAFPASTDVNTILYQFRALQYNKKAGMTVVFSTYQSIEVIAKAQRALANELPQYAQFDLIVCDEAHRTTGVKLADEDESAFTKVHDNEFIKAKKRLYMTATPRLYDVNTQSKAAQAEATLWSMDNTQYYGDEIYRIGFGEAVQKDLLTDYKVLILTLSENDVPPLIQNMIRNGETEINIDDVSKLVGCINALSKQVLGDEGIIKSTDPTPMKRAVAFCSTIANSKSITQTFNATSEPYISELPKENALQTVSVASKHIDGTMSATTREELLNWLKDEPEENECRILTNVRCLSEGVDVPSLDSVMFLSARNSQVDVVQSVGRVMRKAPNKKYGYIIIPVVVPSEITAEEALNDNERFKVVWTVLNALRAHDDRFNATVNKIELNKSKPRQILVGGTTITFDDDGNPVEKGSYDGGSSDDIGNQLSLQFEQLQSVVFARMVQKVGDRRYWEQWAKSVAEIAQRQIERITKLIDESPKHQKAFESFLKGLHKNINPSTTQAEAIEMLSQHIITKPVFDALFENYSFVQSNPMSQSMQRMLDLLEGEALEKDTETLQNFYESVKLRASGIDNAEGKQKIIVELYDKFFYTAFPKMVEKLGIVYTPIEVVDFIIHSVNDTLKKEFNRSLTDENVNILDPFTGTGTFIVRLLQSGLIKPKDIQRKYSKEIFANEIVLLAYYIAAINIENAYHDIQASSPLESTKDNVEYQSFDGICLTDTFQLGETKDGEKLFSEMFPQNSKRVQRQQKAPITVIIGNPPYSVGQKSANDNAQNQKYELLEKRIENTYAKFSNAGLNKSLYDSYIKAFRWSSDRLNSENGGIICFVSNGAWLDGNSTDGFRKALEKEFSSIYIFNLRGNARTTGELNRREGHPLFGASGGRGGSKTPIAITLLVKSNLVQTESANIFYHDIGDYLKRDEKLKIIEDFKTFSNPKMNLIKLKPNEQGDWINKRNESFENFIPIESLKKFDVKSKSFFYTYAIGVNTNRDAWTYNFSKIKIEHNMNQMISFYNIQRNLYFNEIVVNAKLSVEDFVDKNPQKISWTRSLRKDLVKNKSHNFIKSDTIVSSYRPFTKEFLYFNRSFNEAIGLSPLFFPNSTIQNIIICISPSPNDGLSILIANTVANLHFNGDTQCFPLYFYEENKNAQKSLFDSDSDDEYIRRDAISDFIYKRAKEQYGKNVTKEDIFYYVYGFLHSKEYRETFANDLKKMLPRLPLVESVPDFWAFSKAGRKLAELHLNYENYPKPEEVLVMISSKGNVNYEVSKMKFPTNHKKDKRDIIFNDTILIQNIPAKAYEYVVNGKSAIEWIMERYQVTTDKNSGITNNPNDWATEVGNPRYILDLLLSIINVSIQTVDIVNNLPKLKFE